MTDPDGSSITGATVQISANYAGAQDQLALSGVHPGITATQVGDTLTLSGTASTAAYQSALRDVTYANGSDSPSTLLRTVTFTRHRRHRAERLGHEGPPGHLQR